MPGWNECGIYNEACRNQTCAHPTNPRNEVNYLGTKVDTENDVTGSESAPQITGEGEPLYTLHSLTGADVARIEQALRMLRRIYTRDSEGYRAVSELGARVSALNWAE